MRLAEQSRPARIFHERAARQRRQSPGADRRGDHGRRAPGPVSGPASAGFQPGAPAGADPRRSGEARRRGAAGSRPQGESRRGLCRVRASARACRARAAGHPARRRLRGRAPHRHRQAQGPHRASRARARVRHAGQRPHRPLRRVAFGRRRRHAARHRPPPRQGHQRAPRRRENRSRASGSFRAVRGARQRRPPRARLSRDRLGRAGSPARRDRCRPFPQRHQPHQDRRRGGSRAAAAR